MVPNLAKSSEVLETMVLFGDAELFLLLLLKYLGGRRIGGWS